MTTTTLLVRRDRLAETRLRTAEDAPLAPGQVRVALDVLALTANNITYAAFGETMDYWRFFPSGEEGWGIVPVWGFARVVQSSHPGVAVGERLYGYWPLAGSAVLQPDRLTAQGFRDATPHRAGLHAIYNQYSRCAADPFHVPGREAEEALLRPLFITSWLIDDFLADQDFFGARRVILSSASSKTAYGTAFLLARRGGLDVVGLTSAGNRSFCESLGCYTRVAAYDELDAIRADEPCVYVDMAGDAEVRQAVHARFGDQLRHSSAVGGTHVERLAGGKHLAGPRPVLFFAPAQARKRQEDWGASALQERLLASWREFLAVATTGPEPWLQVQRHRGAAAAQAAYLALLAGRSDPRMGHVLDLH